MSSAQQEQDKAFFKTFGIVMVILTGIAIAALLAAYIISHSTAEEGMRPEEVALIKKRTNPDYQGVANAGETQEASADAASDGGETLTGEEVFKQTCHTCHVPGAAGAPKVSDKAAWEERYADGIETMYKRAINGFNAMPPKGGNPKLTDQEVKDTVDYILKRSGVTD